MLQTHYAASGDLKEHHSELIEVAKQYEKIDDEKGIRYTWKQAESLSELEQPERMAKIKRKQEESMSAAAKRAPSEKLFRCFSDALDEEDDTKPCMVCNL